jgi:paraquat-inducible protein B
MLQKFYHSTIRKAVVAFGNLFNNIFIDRSDQNGNVVQTLKIPLMYAPRQKFLARIDAISDSLTRSDIQVILPRMAFEMLSIQYDPTRRVSLIQQNRANNNTSNTVNSQYVPSPYNIQMALYIYVKNQDDGLQILEQILPYFNPDFNLSINAIPQLDIKNDLPIVLDDVQYQDDYEGDFEQRRAIIWTLNFTLKLNFFGPINRADVIKNVTVNNFTDQEFNNRIQRINTTVNPSNATAGNVISYVDTFEEF